MPKSDTWPGGVGSDTMTVGMDSAGSWDSVLSANSLFSDDSMEHLSAEEKACLMFLEETIESLDTEEDSGLSNDEPDRLPSPGNLANKMADLSASMSQNKLTGLHKHTSQEPEPDFVDAKPKQSYLVPTPLVVASSSPGSDRTLGYKPHFTPPSNKPDLHQKPVAARVPPEANVAMPPPVKPRDHSVRKAEGPPLGPLTYEALVHLRRSASAKKTPLCPTLDHTVATAGGPNLGDPPRSDRSHPEACRSKTGPPVVGPKPKRIPANMSVRRRDEASVTADPPLGTKNATDPQGVRLEALQKLGLLKDREPEKESVAPLPAPKPHFSLDPMPNRFTRGPPHVNPPRSPSLCHSQGPKNKPLQSSASFHHNSRSDQQSASDPNGTRATGLERSATLDNHRNGPPAPRKPENPVGYTVMAAPGMGADRKEALRKLGLLSD